MDKIFIDYGKRINQAILCVIKEILKDLSKSKISSNHCFYMTIVLQNQYWDLKIKKNDFSVTLLFNKKKEFLTVPFNSITKFYDPFVKFSIQLDCKEEKKENQKNKLTKKKISKQKIISLEDFRKKDD